MEGKQFYFLWMILGGILLTGCQNQQQEEIYYNVPPADAWQDGTYTETVMGKNGEFEVEVVILNHMITEVKVGSHTETENRGGAAIELIPSTIIQMQHPNVDALSGATITSEAIKEAVASCLNQASNE